MGLFDSLQDLVSGAADNLAEVPGVQELQDLAGGATDAASGLAEQGQNAVEDITKNLGL